MFSLMINIMWVMIIAENASVFLCNVATFISDLNHQESIIINCLNTICAILDEVKFYCLYSNK